METQSRVEFLSEGDDEDKQREEERKVENTIRGKFEFHWRNDNGATALQENNM